MESAMAKTTVKTAGPSRVRFIMLDAELNDGDLSQITQAIQNALAPIKQSPARLVTGNISLKKVVQETDAEEVEADEITDEEDQSEVVQPVARARGPRKYKSPKVLDLDLTSAVSLEEYARSKKTDTDVARNLVIAAWFKQFRSMDTITADHVYTCYRAMSWPTAISDFAKPLKNLKQRQLFDGKDGSYSINHLGIARVEKNEN